MDERDPKFPPLLTGHAVKAPITAFDEACRRAELGELGAGDLVWSRHTGRAELALILEPEVPGSTALQMVPLAFVAVADALGQLMPPQTAVENRWPGTIVINGGAAGTIRAALSDSPGLEPPRWLVIGVTITLRSDPRGPEPGDRERETALAEEGGGDITRSDLVEAIGKHLLVWINTWSEDGFRPVAEQWLFRAENREGGSGRPRLLGLDEEGGLITRVGNEAARVQSVMPHISLWNDGAERGRAR